MFPTSSPAELFILVSVGALVVFGGRRLARPAAPTPPPAVPRTSPRSAVGIAFAGAIWVAVLFGCVLNYDFSPPVGRLAVGWPWRPWLFVGVTTIALMTVFVIRAAKRGPAASPPPPARTPTPGEKRLIAALFSSGTLLGWVVAAIYLARVYRLGTGDRDLAAILFLLLGTAGVAYLHIRLSRWAYPDWWRHRSRLLYPDLAPAGVGGLPGAEPSPPPATPPGPRVCPKCHAALAADAPQGLCPKCLLQGAFASAVSPHGTAAYAGPGTAPTPEEVAEFFPQLEILGFVGQGGMGAVYKARQPALDRVVALKLIQPRDDDPTFAERFAREAKALAKLSHPNIVTIHEFGETGGSQYLLMEYVDGTTLREAMRAKAVPPAAALKVIGQICDALQFAHDRGVVHRDVKPENILLGKDGAVKIADFGLAKVADPGGPSLTRTHQAMGTPHYMAPEQWEKPAEVDHRADIFALGVVFYELLTGELPIGRFDPPSRKVQVDVRIDEVVFRALEREPGRRFQAVIDLRTAVDTIGRSPYRRAAGKKGPGFWEYKSARTLFGWPLLHIVQGVDPITGKQPWAKGVVAIGGQAIGGVAIGGVSVGVVSLGGISFGGLAIGGVAIGLFAVAGMALALIAAAGGMALAPLFAAGGQAVAYYAVGGHPVGVHTFGGDHPDPAPFLQAIKDDFARLVAAVGG